MNDPRYKTARWRRIRGVKLASEPLCHYCFQLGRTTPATTVDHADPVARGGDFWANENHRSACEACNYAKQDKTESEFLAKGCGADGIPLSPNHPWNQEGARG